MKKKKIIAICMSIGLCISTLAMLNYEKNATAAGQGDPVDTEIDYDYIYGVIKDLSNIIDSYPKGRDFGTPGERDAADYIESEMSDLGLSNVDQDTINAVWTHKDSWAGLSGIGDNYIGKLNKKRVADTNGISLTYTVYENGEPTGNPTTIDCFPLFKAGLAPFHNVFEEDCPVVLEFQPSLENQVILLEADWTDPFNSWADSPKLGIKILGYRAAFLSKNVAGFIVMDDFDNTIFMSPSFNDHLLKFGSFLKPGFSISGSNGDSLIDYIEDEDYEVEADIKSYWSYDLVESYNVIGEIPVQGSEEVSIICAHYDCWYNQGTIDEAAETAICLGIAKFIKDNELTPTHTLKFIAFGAEEHGFRGSKDYIKKYIINGDEEIKYVINPGNFGHGDSDGDTNGYEDIPFKFHSSLPWIRILGYDIANQLDYTDITGNDIDYLHGKPFGEDSAPFYFKGFGDQVQFSRSPFKGYHRDGNSHTEGDVLKAKGDFSGLHNESFSVESDIVLYTTLQLCFEDQIVFDDCDYTPYDRCGDGNNDSVRIDFDISSNLPSFGKIEAGIYDGSTLVSKKNITEYLNVYHDSTTTGYVNVTLLPNQVYDEYSVKVKLIDFQDNEDDVDSDLIYLYPYGEPIADFIASAASTKSYHFTDKSYASPGETIDDWDWDFGDNSYSSQQNPTHNYEEGGTYTVTLTIEDTDEKTDTYSMEINVGNDLPQVSFEMESYFGAIEDSLSFESESQDIDGEIDNTTWYFGDGEVGYGQQISHSYSTSGFYDVILEITDNDGEKNTTTRTILAADALIDDDFTDNPETYRWDTISEGVANSGVNGIIFVFNGDYQENITIDRTKTIIGEDYENVNISDENVVITITADNVSVYNITIKDGETGIDISGAVNTTVSHCIIKDNYFGINLNEGAEINSILDCDFNENSYGIYMDDTSLNLIGGLFENHTSFFQNTYGIYMEDSHNNTLIGCKINMSPDSSKFQILTTGISLNEATNNTISLCYVYGASNYGIYLDDSNRNVIEQSRISENAKGIYLTSSSKNYIICNNISNNTGSGMTILLVYSENNSVYCNDFIDNGGGVYPQAQDTGARSQESKTDWNYTGNYTTFYNTTGEGNYWSDYTGEDNNDDGIGDTSYTIYGNRNTYDYYPIMKPFGWTWEDLLK